MRFAGHPSSVSAMMSAQFSDPVVITRPATQAGALAERITALGREAVVFPLLEILPLEDDAPLRAELAELRRYAMVAFVSPNAIDAAFSVLRTWPDGVALAVVGEGSRSALARHGITSDNALIYSPRGTERADSQALAEAIDIEALRGKQVLIVRGESGREFLADALRDAGVQVRQIAAYRRIAPVLDLAGQTQLRRLLDARSEWIVTSSEALRNLVHMANQAAEEAGVVKLQHQHLIVPHHRIEETARLLGFQRVSRTGPGDERILAALQFRR